MKIMDIKLSKRVGNIKLSKVANTKMINIEVALIMNTLQVEIIHPVINNLLTDTISIKTRKNKLNNVFIHEMYVLTDSMKIDMRKNTNRNIKIAPVPDKEIIMNESQEIISKELGNIKSTTAKKVENIKAKVIMLNPTQTTIDKKNNLMNHQKS